LAAISLRGSRFGLAEQMINHFAVNADADTTVEDILKPEYWANVASHLRPHGGDEIVVTCEDMSFRAHLWVVNAGHTWANVMLISEPIVMKAQESRVIPVSDDGRVYAQWRGPHDRWCVMRRETDGTKTKIKVGLSSRDDAEREAKDHLRVILKPARAAE
jgi:hypothetical protein